jgi:hypothetical protein
MRHRIVFHKIVFLNYTGMKIPAGKVRKHGTQDAETTRVAMVTGLFEYI